ncbi:MAG: hypothetical protein A2Z14_13390 [Chloroflexi bacterium RBG_16_48_8]|nr:MAG: hypothetical protein A2Z14_13390 [Chloroflexi bacterium RBG_16_48_8]
MEPILTPDDAWGIVLSYTRRWQIEETLRHAKCELAFESPYVRAWETRRKWLLIAPIAYAFLVSQLDPDRRESRDWLLRN